MMDNALEKQQPLHIPSIDALKVDTVQQLGTIQTHEQTINLYLSNLDLLIQRYNNNKSYLSQAAEYYGQQEWWIKLIFAIVLTCIGTLMSIPIILSITLSLALSFLFINHHDVSEQRTAVITEDIKDQRTALTTSLNHLSSLKQSLEKTLGFLDSIHQKITHDHQQFTTQIAQIEATLARYKTSVAALEDTVKAYQQRNDELITANQTLRQYQEDLKQQMQTHAQIDIESGKVIKSFTDLTAKLGQTSAHLASTVQDLAEAKTPPKDLIDRLTKNLETHDSPPSGFDPEAVKKETETLVQEAAAQSDEFEKLKVQFQARTPPRQQKNQSTSDEDLDIVKGMFTPNG